ncbi:MAG: ATP-binding cassette domain-containing protein [Clostridiales bacterium]|nr:ATP-binding cassette domain-containing protein [Clostridiales bacterium]
MGKNPDTPLVEVRDVKVHFRQRKNGNETVKAVDGITFAIKRGETFGVVGESGCGKSTLGRAILRLIEPTGGEVFYNGRSMKELSRQEMKDLRQKIQIIFQDPSACLNPRRTVKKILTEPFDVHGIKDREFIDKRIHELVELVGLADYHLSRYPHELSGGQKQRIGIARALALNPELIVCDEAVSALDVSVQAQVINLLEELQKKLGLTYLFISHNLNVVHHISDRVGVMYLGRMVEIATADELYDYQAHPYTKALLSAIPQTETRKMQDRIILQGEVPNPANPPSGCHFHTRCPKCCDVCKRSAPELRDLGDDHLVACHFPEERG